MEVIDEKGRLFGLVNVVDALVVLLAVALVSAGTALVLGTGQPADEAEPTRYATVAYSVPLGSDAAALEAGDELRVSGADATYDVVDVYRSFRPDGSAYVVSRVAYRGTFTADGERLLGGDDASLVARSYRVDASVVDVDQSARTIPTRRASVVLAVNASSSVADAVAAGQEAAIGNRTVATIETVRRVGSDNGSRRLLVGVTLEVWERTTGATFDGELLRVGNRVTLVTDRVVVRGRVHALGTATPTDG